MSKEPNNIDRLVREKLDGFEMAPPPSVWENTAASLHARRKKRFLLWFVFSLALLGIVGTSIYFVCYSGDDKTRLANSTTIDSSDTENRSNSGINADSNTNDESRATNNDASKSELNDTNSSKRDEDDRNAKGNPTSENNSRILEQKRRSSQGTRQTGKSAIIESEGDSELPEDHSATAASFSPKAGNNSTLSLEGSLGSSSLFNPLAIESTQGTEKSTSESATAERYAALPIFDLRPFDLGNASIIEDIVEEDTLPTPTPFWKSISVEGSFGISTFKNQPKKSTPQSLADALNSASNGQQSMDFRFGANYHFTNHFSLQSGIHYQSSKENYSFNSLDSVTYTFVDTLSFTIDSTTMDTTWNTYTYYLDTTELNSNTVQNSYRIFTLPFQFAWSQPISTRGTLEFSLGGAISIFGRNTGKVLLDESGLAMDAQSAYHATGMLSVGGSIKYIHRFGMHHSVYAEPWAQFGVTNQSAPGLSYESLRRRYGIRVGYRFYF